VQRVLALVLSPQIQQKNETRPEKTETAPKEKPSKKNRKKEKEVAESVPVKPKKEKKLLVLPMEASVLGILLLIFNGSCEDVESLRKSDSR